MDLLKSLRTTITSCTVKTIAEANLSKDLAPKFIKFYESNFPHHNDTDHIRLMIRRLKEGKLENYADATVLKSIKECGLDKQSNTILETSRKPLKASEAGKLGKPKAPVAEGSVKVKYDDTKESRRAVVESKDTVVANLQTLKDAIGKIIPEYPTKDLVQDIRIILDAVNEDPFFIGSEPVDLGDTTPDAGDTVEDPVSVGEAVSEVKDQQMFKELYERTQRVQENESPFKPASPEEVTRRKEDYKGIKIQEWKDAFLKRTDIVKNEDGSYDVEGYLDCCDLNLTSLTELGMKFRKVGRDFYCSRNALTTLQGAPQEVSGGFDCRGNKLTTLQGAPQKVGGDFYCDDNKLTTLQGAPQEVGGDFYCRNNETKFTRKDVKAVTADARGRLKEATDPNVFKSTLSTALKSLKELGSLIVPNYPNKQLILDIGSAIGTILEDPAWSMVTESSESTLNEMPFRGGKPSQKPESASDIAKRIEVGAMEETPELLKYSDKDGNTVAHHLADNSAKTKWYTDDKEILKLVNKGGTTVEDLLTKNRVKEAKQPDLTKPIKDQIKDLLERSPNTEVSKACTKVLSEMGNRELDSVLRDVAELLNKYKGKLTSEDLDYLDSCMRSLVTDSLISQA